MLFPQVAELERNGRPRQRMVRRSRRKQAEPDADPSSVNCCLGRCCGSDLRPVIYRVPKKTAAWLVMPTANPGGTDGDECHSASTHAPDAGLERDCVNLSGGNNSLCAVRSLQPEDESVVAVPAADAFTSSQLSHSKADRKPGILAAGTSAQRIGAGFVSELRCGESA